MTGLQLIKQYEEFARHASVEVRHKPNKDGTGWILEGRDRAGIWYVINPNIALGDLPIDCEDVKAELYQQSTWMHGKSDKAPVPADREEEEDKRVSSTMKELASEAWQDMRWRSGSRVSLSSPSVDSSGNGFTVSDRRRSVHAD